MKVLGIAGSLRPKSNTLEYVEKALNVFKDADFETGVNLAHNMVQVMKKKGAQK